MSDAMRNLRRMHEVSYYITELKNSMYVNDIEITGITLKSGDRIKFEKLMEPMMTLHSPVPGGKTMILGLQISEDMP